MVSVPPWQPGRRRVHISPVRTGAGRWKQGAVASGPRGRAWRVGHAATLNRMRQRAQGLWAGDNQLSACLNQNVAGRCVGDVESQVVEPEDFHRRNQDSNPSRPRTAQPMCIPSCGHPPHSREVGSLVIDGRVLFGAGTGPPTSRKGPASKALALLILDAQDHPALRSSSASTPICAAIQFRTACFDSWNRLPPIALWDWLCGTQTV